jgi:hypothetical protein
MTTNIEADLTSLTDQWRGRATYGDSSESMSMMYGVRSGAGEARRLGIHRNA